MPTGASGLNAVVIEIKGVVKRYGATPVVDGIGFSCGEGEMVGLAGHNGAGKSTLFKMMLGIIAADAGDILLFGEPVRGRRFREVRRAIGYLPEHVALYDNLSGLETLRFFARLKSADPAGCKDLLERVGLAGAMHRAVREYSKGMRQRLGFAQALLGEPRLLLLDEPTNGLDPEAIHDFYDQLQQLKNAGTTILLSSHLLAEIQSRVDRLVIMASGKLVATGTVAALAAASGLPAGLALTPREGARERVKGALLAAGLVPLDAPDGTVHAIVAKPHRMTLLRVLAGLSGDLQEYTLTEPTLEDVFLHHQRGTAWVERAA
ncbi:MAG: copper ABC transporter ATP-binding protein [Rhodanobacter sp. 68-29]|nr:MAG: copper ABC transporter ATP-binding protein [Rhodanobacter sp. SCN 69-32]OJY58694.1 MAG: copper ABC transporter ATP-binding protein [Rhodanobacter sp. 68-29]